MDTLALSLSLRDSGTLLELVCLRFTSTISLLAATDLLLSKLDTRSLEHGRNCPSGFKDQGCH